MDHDTTPRKVSPQRSVGLFLLSAVLAVAGGALLMEGAARWLLDDGMNFSVEMWKYARDIKQVSANPEIGHEHRPGTGGVYMGVPVRINAMGLRDREVDPTHKSPDTIRVLMLGDSLTFGWGVRVDDTSSKLLEELLNQHTEGPRSEVINTGVGNYNTTMEVAYFFGKGWQFQPDIVVLNYFINDAEPRPHREMGFLIEYSYAYVMLSSALDSISRQYFGKADWKAYYRSLYSDGASGWKAVQEAIGRLAAYCQENDIKLLVVNHPELHELRDYPFAEVTKAVEATARNNGAEFLDLLPAIADVNPPDLWVSPGDAHPNRTANLRFAEAIRDKLLLDFPDIYERSQIAGD